jgi:DNA-directed RNA polymerase III subunit RPC7
MSFRGGRGGGRGGNSFLSGLRHLDLKPDFGLSELYPENPQPIQTPLTMFEKQAVSQFVGLRAAIQDGPLYTGSNKRKSRVVVEVDRAFDDGIKRYTDRYVKKRKIGRSIDEHPYVVEFFPQELHSAMGLKSSKLKKVDISRFTSELLKANDNQDKDDRELLELKLNRVQEEDNDEKLQEGDEEDEEEEVDEFEEDEDDDYNAERYFENGEDYDNDDDGDDEAAY